MAATEKTMRGKRIKIKPLIIADYLSSNKPEIYRLPETTGFKEARLKHDILGAELYAAYELTGDLEFWYMPVEADGYGLKPDTHMRFKGKEVFWENDRSTEDLSVIKEKIEKYIALSKDNPQRRFHVIFTTVDTPKQTAISRCKAILEIVSRYNRHDQFMVTAHEWALKFPDGSAFVTPLHLDGVSIEVAN